ncbi:hypothetical protein HYV12_00065 [Candidatus Dojkabacteria bacterium]|nr:hypothetical protein [Candidatus Dojkabacteria bacterium]
MSFRDFLWNYPDTVTKVNRGLAPISYIILSVLVVFAFGYYYFTSGAYERLIASGKSNMIAEGTVGSLNNLNPLYIPQSQVDRDLQALLFRKLLKVDSNGTPVGDIVKSWTVSKDLLTYNFVMNEGIRWHDGEVMTADDVIFTFETSKELASKLSQETIGQGFDGLSIEKTGKYRFKIILDQYSATFWESISIYIVPKHILETISLSQIAQSNFSSRPIGSGMFEIVSATDSLVTLKKSSVDNRESSITNYEYHIFKSVKELEVAFRNNRLDVVSGVSLRNSGYVTEYEKRFDVLQTVIGTRKKVLFFNNRIKSLGTSGLRRGLSYLLNRDEIIERAGIDGVSTFSSFSPSSWAYDKSISYYKYDRKKGDAELKGAGYTKDKSSGYYQSTDGKILTISITYLENDINTALVTSIKDTLDKEGIIVELDPQSFERLTKETLATRDYQILLYEIETSIDPDQYDLWHSLRKDYPYLNLSGYTYDRVDIFLEKGRTQVKRADRKVSYDVVQRLLHEDAPAYFIYEPQFTIIVSNKLENISLDDINYPEERYNTLNTWKY